MRAGRTLKAEGLQRRLSLAPAVSQGTPRLEESRYPPYRAIIVQARWSTTCLSNCISYLRLACRARAPAAAGLIVSLSISCPRSFLIRNSPPPWFATILRARSIASAFVSACAFACSQPMLGRRQIFGVSKPAARGRSVRTPLKGHTRYAPLFGRKRREPRPRLDRARVDIELV
jgi:hypothetical protein